MARTYEGISGSKLDKIKVFLRWKTAESYEACPPALLYWEKEYQKRDLLITPERIHEFDTVWMDDMTGFDVAGWVDQLTFDPVFVPACSALDLARCLKVGLLRRFKPEVYKRLGGTR